MIFGRTLGKRGASFALELAEEFFKRYPPGTDEERASPKLFARTVDELCIRAQTFQREAELGILGKARFGTEFKYRLRELGYPEAMIDDLTRILLIRMSGK